MLNHDLNRPGKWPQLTLSHSPHRSQPLSRLQPCGKLEQKHSGLACKVFLKRSRLPGSRLLRPAESQKKQRIGTGAVRIRRRGSFLRLAAIRNH